jgi:hypothetical protein
MQIETWPVTRLVPYARNPRKNDRAVERTAAAIQEFGFRLHIYGDATGEGRQSSASRTDWQIVREFFGRTRIPTVRLSKCPPPTRRSRIGSTV